MVPADMGKLQVVHELMVKSHRINLEVEFIVERLAPEARRLISAAPGYIGRWECFPLV
jgi:hypothetical protein